MTSQRPRFPQTWCSQCGEEQGPGDHGFSHCQDHRRPKIITRNIFPPIPDRQFDWCAYRDGEEERGHYGYGPTEHTAIADLIENVEGVSCPR